MDGTTKPQGPHVGLSDGVDLDLGDLILGAPGVLVAVIDQDNHLTRANPNFEKISGFTLEELRGKTLQALIQEPLIGLLDQVRQAGTPQELESALEQAGAEPMRVRWNFQALAQPPGWILATGLEMPEPERQDDFHNSQFFLSKLLAAETNFICIFDTLENRFTYSNRGLGEFMGFSAENPTINGADLFHTLLHPDDLALVMAYYEKLVQAAENEILEAEYRLRHADGAFHWILNRSLSFSRRSDGQTRLVLSMSQDITSRRTAEELHLRLVEIIESTPDVVATLRPDGTLVYLNWSGRQLLGLGLDDLTGSSLRDMAAPAVVEHILRESIPAAIHHGYWAGDAALTAEDDEQVAVSLVIVAHPSPATGVEYLSLIARDMRETRRMQTDLLAGRDELELRVAERTAELHRSEALYRSLAEAAPDMVFVFARDGQVEYLNQNASEQLERPAGEMAGHFITEIFPTAVALQLQSSVLKVFKTGEPLASEGMFHFSDGDHWFNTILVPIREDNAAVTSVLGVSRDITSRRQIEDELFQSRQMLQLILDNVPQRVFWKDRDLRYLGANQLYLRDTGLKSIHEILGKDDFAIHPKEFAELYRADDFLVITGGESKLNYEEKQTTGEGKTEWLRTNKVPLRGQDQEIIGLIGTYEDITELKQAEMLLAARNEELLRSNADLEQFAYIASHDLQEPLRMVASFAQLFARRYQGTLDERGEKYLTYVVDGAYRMQQLIDDLLKYSRLGTRGLSIVTLNCDQLVSQVLFNLQVALRETGAVVKVETLPTVQADDTQFLQLFQNLVGNAVKFHGEAPPQVRIWAERDGSAWRFGIADNGIGIDPRFNERIFVIFQRLHSREEYPGTGIGLAVCKKIVQRHGGRIWFESTPGLGTTFFFTIPDQQEGI